MAKKKVNKTRQPGVNIPRTKKIYQSDPVIEPEQTGLNTQQSFRFAINKNALR